MSRIVNEKDENYVAHLDRQHSHTQKGPGHIDVHEVDEKELEAAEDAALAESEFT